MKDHAVIRPASLDDFEKIDEFDPFAGDRRAEIELHRMLVAEADQKVIGYVSWVPKGFVGRNYITYLCVRPDYRRQGIALRMLNAAETAMAGGRLYVSTEEDNMAMLALLRRQCWITAGAVAGANDGDRAEVFFYKDPS